MLGFKFLNLSGLQMPTPSLLKYFKAVDFSLLLGIKSLGTKRTNTNITKYH